EIVMRLPPMSKTVRRRLATVPLDDQASSASSNDPSKPVAGDQFVRASVHELHLVLEIKNPELQARAKLRKIVDQAFMLEPGSGDQFVWADRKINQRVSRRWLAPEPGRNL